MDSLEQSSSRRMARSIAHLLGIAVITTVLFTSVESSEAHIYEPVSGGAGMKTVTSLANQFLTVGGEPYLGGGAYLFNSPGAFYMGRVWPSDKFSVNEQAVSENFAGHTYRWGRSQARGGQACFWVGPRAASLNPPSGYLSSSNSGSALSHCNSGQKESLITTQTRFGSDFTCPVGDDSAGGPMQTWLTAPTQFHYNVTWNVSGSGTTRTYTAGSAQANPQGTIVLPAMHLVKYRYTSGSWAVVYAKNYGWGFVQKSAVKVAYSLGNRWGRQGNEVFGGLESACADRDNLNMPAYSPKADIALYESVPGRWAVAPSIGSMFMGPSTWISNWGPNGVANGYEPLTGDFNGDGRTDFGIFDPNGGHWSVHLSTGSGVTSGAIWLSNWGQGGPGNNYRPLAADFSGDGKTDVAIYDPNNGYWSVATSTGGSFNYPSVWISNWGPNGVANGYEPLTGDFNGDGRTDFGIFDPNGGHWSVHLSTGSGVTGAAIWNSNFGSTGTPGSNKPLVGYFTE